MAAQRFAEFNDFRRDDGFQPTAGIHVGLAMFGVIYPPQVALVGFGKPAQRVCAVEGGIRIATTVQSTLAADHRASDGHRGALFLAAINELLQRPDLLEK